MATLDYVYRDVFSNVRLFNFADQVREQDIINAINQSIRKLRAEYARNGITDGVTTTETINSFSTDSDYTFLKSGTLSNNILSEVPIEIAVLAISVSITGNTIQNTTQTFNEGDIAEYNGNLYEAVRDIINENTFGFEFDKTNVRMYKANNGLKYRAGEIVYNIDDSKYYKVNSDFTAESGTSDLVEVIWRKLGKSNITGVAYPLNALRHILLHDYEKQAISINKNKIFVNDIVDSLVITYIPEWTEVTDRNSELDVPESMIPLIINDSTNKILRKLNVPVEDNE